MAYVLLNLLSGTGIVFANKLVLSVLEFHYVRRRPGAGPSPPQAVARSFHVPPAFRPRSSNKQAGSAGAPALLTCGAQASQVYALTFIHSVVTMFGMWAFAAAGMYEVKQLQALQVHDPPCSPLPSTPAAFALGLNIAQPNCMRSATAAAPLAERALRPASSAEERQAAGLPAGGGLCRLRGPVEPEPAAQPGRLLPAGQDRDHARHHRH